MTMEDAKATLRRAGKLPPAPAPDAKRAPIKRKMTKPELQYAQLLELEQRSGKIARFAYEAVKLRLAPNTHYTPDFAVWTADGKLEFHETKGEYVREDGWLKLKLAAAAYPEHRFVYAQLFKTSWKFKEVPAR